MTDAELIAELERLHALALEVDDTHPTLAFARAAYEHAPRLLALAKAGMSAEETNVRLRAALATSKDPCIYCQLPAEEMGKCRAGFPGCARMDDLSGCPEFGATMEIERLTAANKALVEAAGPFVQVTPIGGSFKPDGEYSILFAAHESDRLCSADFRALSRAVEAASHG